MAGMHGYNHTCSEAKVNIAQYKSTINTSSFSKVEISRIWEFYVSKSPAEQSSQSISLLNYGWANNNNRENGFHVLEKALVGTADNLTLCFVRAKTIKDTLSAMDLANDSICICHPRGVLMQEFEYQHDENETVRVESKEARVRCLFRHIRNAFAHGNTYFLPNDMVMFEDKERGSSGKITTRLLMPQQALLKWMTIVDRDNILPKET